MKIAGGNVQSFPIRTGAIDTLRQGSCHFGDGEPGPMPKIIRLHFVRDEALAV